jgi:hypothetical protein
MLPDYNYFGQISIKKINTVSEDPYIEWQIKNCINKNKETVLDWSFALGLKDGQPFLGLVTKENIQLLAPKLIPVNKSQQNYFIGMRASEYKKIVASIEILEQQDRLNWRGMELEPEFDLNFWRSTIRSVISDFKKLPPILRYDNVTLKRELVNVDYQHLWLEIHNLSYRTYFWKKFEIRLGASMFDEKGFSRHPKFEIPLIDGEEKPFNSWYPESVDGDGPTLELRFSLDRSIFDISVWAKLSDDDKRLMMNLVYSMPRFLESLNDKSDMLHQPLTTWVEFATSAAEVMSKILNNPKSDKKLTSNSKMTSLQINIDSASSAYAENKDSEGGSSATSKGKNIPQNKVRVINVSNKSTHELKTIKQPKKGKTV